MRVTLLYRLFSKLALVEQQRLDRGGTDAQYRGDVVSKQSLAL
jgi:hypothetical protein